MVVNLRLPLRNQHKGASKWLYTGLQWFFNARLSILPIANKSSPILFGNQGSFFFAQSYNPATLSVNVLQPVVCKVFVKIVSRARVGFCYIQLMSRRKLKLPIRNKFLKIIPQHLAASTAQPRSLNFVNEHRMQGNFEYEQTVKYCFVYVAANHWIRIQKRTYFNTVQLDKYFHQNTTICTIAYSSLLN